MISNIVGAEASMFQFASCGQRGLVAMCDLLQPNNTGRIQRHECFNVTVMKRATGRRGRRGCWLA
jgi:hypothetical protein